MNAGDMSVSKPASAPNEIKAETWYAYGMGESLPSSLENGLRSPGELITQQFVNLWEMIAPVGHILLVTIQLLSTVSLLTFNSRYGCSDITSHDLQRICYKVTEDLFAWKRNLSPILQIDLGHDTGPAPPHLLMLQ